MFVPIRQRGHWKGGWKQDIRLEKVGNVILSILSLNLECYLFHSNMYTFFMIRLSSILSDVQYSAALWEDSVVWQL